MRILILHSSQPKLVDWAKSLQGALENLNCRVELGEASAAGGGPISTAQYKLVCVLSPFKGVWRPIIPREIDELLKRCNRLDGKKGAVFVPTRFGSSKALKFLMQLMEVQGMIVEDFASVRSVKDLPGIAERLASLASR